MYNVKGGFVKNANKAYFCNAYFLKLVTSSSFTMYYYMIFYYITFVSPLLYWKYTSYKFKRNQFIDFNSFANNILVTTSVRHANVHIRTPIGFRDA